MPARGPQCLRPRQRHARTPRPLSTGRAQALRRTCSRRPRRRPTPPPFSTCGRTGPEPPAGRAGTLAPAPQTAEPLVRAAGRSLVSASPGRTGAQAVPALRPGPAGGRVRAQRRLPVVILPQLCEPARAGAAASEAGGCVAAAGAAGRAGCGAAAGVAGALAPAGVGRAELSAPSSTTAAADPRLARGRARPSEARTHQGGGFLYRARAPCLHRAPDATDTQRVRCAKNG